MSALGVFEKIFGPKNQASGTPANPGVQPVTNNLATNPPPQNPHSSQVTAPNGAVPPEGNTPPKESPEAKFEKLWENPATDPNEGNPDANSGLTPEKMLEAAGKVDFKRILDPTLLQKISGGGEEAVAAMAELLNKTAQTVYGQSTVVAQKLAETQIARAREELTRELPNLVRKQAARESLLSENPAFNKPTVAPIVAAVQQQLQQKYPNATVTELNNLAREFIQVAVADLSPAPKKSDTPQDTGTNWDDWVTTGLPASAKKLR